MIRFVPTVADFSDEMVLTVPGFLAGRRSMQRLGDGLRSAGYVTRHWDYPSLRGSILSHAARLRHDLGELVESSQVRRVHLVTHSMGGVIARAAILGSGLETRWREKCGRMVMMAPPNEGSRLTRIPLGPFASWFPQLGELSESPDSLVRCLPPLRQMKVGIIAAARDIVVSCQATHLPGECDHITLPTTHQGLKSDPNAIERTLCFLRSESFQSEPATIPFESPASSQDREPEHRSRDAAA